MSELKAEAGKNVDANNWIKIGENADRDVLKQAAEKIRARWLGRYDFEISSKDEAKKGYVLRLRHR